MRITICCKQFLKRGGAETFLVNFARCLVADGHEVTVLTPRADRPPEGVRVRPLHVPWRPRALRDLALARASREALADDDADVTFSDQKCWSADVVRPGGGVQREYVRQRQKSYRGGLPALANRAARALSLRERLRIYLDDRLYAPPGPKCIIANSDMVRRELLNHYAHLEGRIRVAYNGADLDRFSPELKSRHGEAVRAELGISPDALVALFVGHDWRRKGLYTFVEALGLLGREGLGRPVCGVVVGRGNRRKALTFAPRGSAAGLLRFVGPAMPDPYYGAADVFVFPSYYDPCANVTIEALACGLPVITSRFNGAYELLTPGVDGFYVDDASDAEGVAGFLRQFADEDRLRAASAAARELALRHPVEGMYRDLVEAISPLAEGRDG